MSVVELAYEDLVELPEHFLCVSWKRHDVVEVYEADIDSFLAHVLYSRKQMSVSSAPSDNEELSALRTIDLKLRNLVCHSLHLLLTFSYHQCMVLRI